MVRILGLALSGCLLCCIATAQTPLRVSSGEYFWDADPGIGNGNAFSIATPLDSVGKSLSVAAPVALKPGQHFFYLRTRADSAGFNTVWSAASGRAFIVRNRVLRAEYFIDNDPGQGSGTALAVSPQSDSISISASVITPSGLQDGRHQLYVRTQSADSLWSLAASQSIFITPKIVAAEYYFDTDPGVGNAAPLTVATSADTITIAAGISVAGLAGGSHTLFVRTKSGSGRWGLPGKKDIYVLPEIIAAEYFWDTDPGQGNATALSLPGGTDSVQRGYTIHTPCLSPGMHYLYTRTRNDAGSWGLTGKDSIVFVQPNLHATAVYPGPGPYGTPVKVAATGGAGPYKYAYLPGAAVTDSIFLAPNNTAVSFVAADTCGYTDTAGITTPAAPTAIAAANTDSGSISFTGWRHWVYVTDAGGSIIGALRDGGQNLGNVTFSYLKNAGSVRTFPANGVPYLDRNFLVQTANVPASPAGVQLYALNAEYNALAAADPSITAKSSLYITKYDGPNQDLSCTNNAPGGTLLPSDSVVSFSSPAGNGYALAFSVGSFSEFYESRNYVVPLPLQSIQLSAVAVNGGIKISWQTENEQSIAKHTLLKQDDAGSWQPLTVQSAKNMPSNDYIYQDSHVVKGVNLYKVKTESLSGIVSYSAIARVNALLAGTISVYPNPPREKVYVQGADADAVVTINDIDGRIIRSASMGKAVDGLDFSGISTGTYLLSVRSAAGEVLLVQRLDILP